MSNVIHLDASDLDRAWFKRKPHRHYRMRKPHPGEWAFLKISAPPGATAVVLVEQLCPGVRLRKPLTLTGWPPAELREDDGFIAGILELAIGEPCSLSRELMTP